jgi:hypothetical protein
MVRNTPEGRGYLQMIIDKEPEYRNHGRAEQQVIIDTIEEHADIVKVVQQKHMNCYIDQLYAHLGIDHKIDILGMNGEWQQGDWILHLPGLDKPTRINVIQSILQLIVR